MKFSIAFKGSGFVAMVWAIAGTLTPIQAQVEPEKPVKATVQILQADAILRDQTRPHVQRLVGDVVLGYQQARLFCDSAFRYDDGHFETLGDVRLVDGAQEVRASALELDPNRQRVRAESTGTSPVRMKANKGRVEAEVIVYGLDTKSASFPKGGVLTSESRTVNFERGTYDVPATLLRLGGVVEVKTPDYGVESDSVHWNETAASFSFHGPSHVWTVDGTFELWCSAGVFDEASESGWFSDAQGAQVRDGSVWLKAQRLELPADSLTPSRAEEQVEIRDTAEHWLLSGAFAERWGRNGSSEELRVVGSVDERVVWLDFQAEDTLALVADTLHVIGQQAIAWPHVVVHQGAQSHATCDRLEWNRSGGHIALLGQPRMWLENWYLMSDSMEWKLADNRPNFLRSWGHAGLTKPVDEGCMQQIVGREINGAFKLGVLTSLLINGNAESVYFNEEDEDPCAAFNRSLCSRMRIDFVEREVEQIVLLSNPEGTWRSDGELPPTLEYATWHAPPQRTWQK